MKHAAIISAVVETAAREIGVREERANWGAKVGGYLKEAGINFPAPWCAAFTYAITSRTLARLGLPNPVIRSAYCPLIASWAEQHEILFSKPERGDYFLYYGKGTGGYRARHIGFVSSVTGNAFKTIEGNTNLGGSPEGIGVFDRTRPVDSRYRFVRWARLLDAPEESEVSLIVGDQKWGDLPLIDGRTLAPVRWWGEKMGFRVGWDGAEQAVTFNEQEVETEITLKDGTAYAPLRDLARFSGLLVQFRPEMRQVVVSKK